MIVPGSSTIKPSSMALPAGQRGAACRAISDTSVTTEEAIHPALHGMLEGILAKYWERAPTAEAVMEVLAMYTGEGPVYFDHFAFRTFGVDGLGIESIAQAFTRFGYTQRDQFSFPGKKLNAYWYAPPGGTPNLPRVFISELLVEELSPGAQQVVRRYATEAATLGPYAVIGSITGTLPWSTPRAEDYDALLKESEYAAWTLVNGYALNHTTISVHRLPDLQGGIQQLNAQLQAQGYRLNDEGGVLKVSPDGGLLQSSTVADMLSFQFAGGQQQVVPGPYLEFAERLVLPQFKNVAAEHVEERHRRDGFEVGNADKIFDSTRLAAAGVE